MFLQVTIEEKLINFMIRTNKGLQDIVVVFVTSEQTGEYMKLRSNPIYLQRDSLNC